MPSDLIVSNIMPAVLWGYRQKAVMTLEPLWGNGNQIVIKKRAIN
jgi:hypothetical protein